ncbi:MAG: hypothetical protein BroJett029_27870 [Alphaproteobacteria bacterium]|nr:MAG: hypothetical protein BroJett029_27870 [Alphaproteobacteria bacterium]
MTRFTDKEKVALERAKAAVATTRTDSSASTDRGNALQRWLRRAAVVRELSQLEDRMLADIGLERWQIEELADRVTGNDGRSVVSALVATLVAPAIRWHRRNEAYRQLAGLDDRMLSDIGIVRGDIPQIVGSWNGETPTSPAEQDATLLRGIRQWNRSRATAKALHALDNHMLDDIGLVRGDIDWVAEELAAQSVWTAANRNHEPRAA